MIAKMGATAALSGRRLDIAGAVTIVVLTSVAYIWGLQPTFGRRAALNAQAEALADRKQEAKEVQQSLNALQRQTAELREALVKKPVQLLAPERSNERMAELAGLISEHGLVVHELLSSPATSSERFKLVPIHLSGRGTFDQCTSFLHELHAKHRDMGPWTIELVDNPGERDAQLDFRFEVTWYAAPLVASGAE